MLNIYLYSVYIITYVPEFDNERCIECILYCYQFAVYLYNSILNTHLNDNNKGILNFHLSVNWTVLYTLLSSEF